MPDFTNPWYVWWYENSHVAFVIAGLICGAVSLIWRDIKAEWDRRRDDQ